MDIAKLQEAIVNDDEDDVVNYFISQTEDSPDLLCAELFDGLPVVHFICKDGSASAEILKFFLDNGGDVNQPSSEVCFCAACKYW